MMRSDDGTWTVTVCRDFDDIMRTWKARKEPDRDVGVLQLDLISLRPMPLMKLQVLIQAACF